AVTITGSTSRVGTPSAKRDNGLAIANRPRFGRSPITIRWAARPTRRAKRAPAGQAVYEPFSGSGTTIIAAEMTGRSCHAIEIDPIYVDVAIKRWQEFVGEKATGDGDGRTFEAVAAERAPAQAVIR